MANGKPRKVLLALKECPGIRTLKNELEAVGYSVDIARNGIKALKLIADEPAYDILITEMLFDDISGFALHMVEKEKNKFCKTIALNNRGSVLFEIGDSLGMDKILCFPWDVKKLCEEADCYVKAIMHQVFELR